MKPLHHRKVTLPPVARKGRAAKTGHRERVAARQAEAMMLKVAGLTNRRIAERLNVTAMTVTRDIRAALTDTLIARNGAAEEYRALELARLDSLTTFCWSAAQNGDVEAVRAIVRISERRSRLLGLDAAVAQKLELSGGAPLVMTVTDHPYSHLTTEELAARIDALRSQLPVMPSAPEAPGEPPPPPTAEERYLAILAARSNGGPH